MHVLTHSLVLIEMGEQSKPKYIDGLLKEPLNFGGLLANLGLKF